MPTPVRMPHNVAWLQAPSDYGEPASICSARALESRSGESSGATATSCFSVRSCGAPVAGRGTCPARSGSCQWPSTSTLDRRGNCARWCKPASRLTDGPRHDRVVPTPRASHVTCVWLPRVVRHRPTAVEPRSARWGATNASGRRTPSTSRSGPPARFRMAIVCAKPESRMARRDFGEFRHSTSQQPRNIGRIGPFRCEDVPRYPGIPLAARVRAFVVGRGGRDGPPHARK